MKMDKKTIGKIIAGLLAAVMLWLVFAGSALSAEIWTLHEREANTNAIDYVTAVEAEAMLQSDPNVVLLDVRTAAEFSLGHISGARCVPVSGLRAQARALDRGARVVVYADGDAECAEACAILAESGFGRVYNLHGGLEAWKGAGFGVSGSGGSKFEGEITHATYPKSETCFYKGFSDENISSESTTRLNLQTTSSDEEKSVGSVSVSGQTATITFEKLGEGQVVGTNYPGLTFSLPWKCADHATGNYNDYGYPPRSGTKLLWTGLGASSGTITFDTPVSSVTAWFSTYLGVKMEGYDADGNPIANDSLGQVYGYSLPITLAPTEGLIKSVKIHDTANYWTMDDLSYVSAKTPWILVHGWRGKSSNWNEWIKPKGFCEKNNIPCETVELSDGTPEERAAELDTKIKEIKKNIKKDYPDWDGKYNIIAHSQGGLDARYYIHKKWGESGTPDVQKLVMIGTPNHGSAMAIVLPPRVPLLGRWLFGRWLTPGNVERFNGNTHKNGGVKYYTIAGNGGRNWFLRGKDDGLVPVNNVNRKGDGYTSLGIFHCTHMGLLKSGNVFNAILDDIDPPVSSDNSSELMPFTPLTQGVINPNETKKHTITIDQSTEAAFSVFWMDGDLNLTLKMPNGTLINPSVAEINPNIEYVVYEEGPFNYEFYAVKNPVPGDWTANVTAINVPSGGADYTVTASLQTNLTLEVSTDKDWYEPDEQIEITANISENDLPIMGATVIANITRPDNVTDTLYLFDDGIHDDSLANDGIYANAYTSTSTGGFYNSIFSASGTNLTGSSFTRGEIELVTVLLQTATFNGSYSDYGTDTDGDGLYNDLTVEIGVNVSIAGNYSFNGILEDENRNKITQTYNSTYLDVGDQTVILNFDGIAIHKHRTGGVYNVSDLSIFDENGMMVDCVCDGYTTSPYNYTDFQPPLAEFTDNYSDYGTDTGSDGLYDYLTIDVELNVINAGNYTIEGTLFGDNTSSISASNCSYCGIGIQHLLLNFDGIAIYENRMNGSYNLNFLRLYDENGNLLDYRFDACTTSTYNYTDFQRPSAVFINYSDHGTDTNSDGLYDNLTVDIGVIVANASNYTMNAILMDKNGNELILASNSSYLYANQPQTMQLDFDGRYVYGSLLNGSFYLKDLYVYNIANLSQYDLVHDAYTTSSYNYTDFEKAGVIIGRVADKNDTSLSNAFVSVTGGADYDYTNETGDYSLTILENGSYPVTVNPPYGTNLMSNSTTVIVTQGKTTFANFTLHEGGIITGTVTHENGTGIPNVEIEADGISHGWGYTNATGGYTISGLESGTYAVTAYAPYGSGLIDSSTTASVSAGETTVVNLILHRPATITGRITDENGTGIQNAQVSISSETTWDDTYTDYNGYYTITGLEEGNCYISAYPPSGTNLISNSTSIYIKAGQTTTVNLTLEEGGILTGIVTDRNGMLIYNARVSTSGTGWESDNTNSSGYYEIIGLRTGTYRIETHGETGTNLVNVTCTEITQKETTTLNITLHEGGMVTGRVSDKSGAGVSNTYVRASGPIYVSTNTDSTGYYTVEGLINGTYIVRAEGYWESNLLSNPIGAEIKECETIEINFTLRTGGIITGRVTDENGLPIADIDVNAYSTQGYWSSGWDYTDYDGYYMITGLQSGEYTVTAYGSWYDLADNSTTASVQLGETTTANLVLQEGGTLTGEVTYENGIAAPFMDVSAIGKSRGWDDETDSAGRYTINGLQDGEYTIIASEYLTNLVNRTTATVTSGDTTTANLTLNEGGIVKGRVTDVNGTGIADAWVNIYISQPTGYHWYGYYNGNQTNSTGYYIIQGIPDGTYNISASPLYGYCIPEIDLAGNSSVVTVTQGQTTVHDFILQKGGAIKGRVSTRDGTGVAGAFVSAEGSDYTYTDVSGNYTITMLQAGTYDVWAYPPSGAGLSSNSTSADVLIGQAALNIDIILSSNPIALFDYSPPNPVVNQTITFNASSSYDPDGTIVKYEWDFGDGNTTTTTENTTAHSYAVEGYYNVILTVTNDNGAANQTSKITAVTILRGDMNRDGALTSTDATITLEIAVGSRQFDDVADVSGDGRVTSLDALMILQAASGRSD